MRNKYYAVYGNNGFGVYTNYIKAIDQRRYLFKSNLKRLDTKQDAFEYAIAGYNNLQDIYDFRSQYLGNGKFTLDWIYYRKDIKAGKY